MPRRFHRDLAMAAASLFAFLFAAVLPAFAETLPAGDSAVEQTADRWTASFNSQVQYYSWKSSSGYPPSPSSPDGEGTQIYIPVGFGLTGQPSDVLTLEFLVRSGYIRSRQTTAGLSGTSEGMADTTLSGTVSYSGWTALQPFLSLNTNLPTGNAELNGSAVDAHMDPDVVKQPTFGEGWNGGISTGANIPITEVLIASVGAGYTYRGAYHSTSVSKLDPGDTYTFNIGLGYQGDSVTVQTQLAYTGETETKLNGVPYYQSGGSIASTLSLAYAWNEAFASRVSTSYSHYEKNKVLIGGLPPLVDEALNSNSDVFQIDLDTTWSTETFSIGPTLGFLYRDRNAWSATDLQFLPAKTRWSVGLTSQYALSDTLVLSAQASRIWVHQNESPDKTLLGPGSGIPKIDTDAWLLSIGANWQF